MSYPPEAVRIAPDRWHEIKLGGDTGEGCGGAITTKMPTSRTLLRLRLYCRTRDTLICWTHLRWQEVWGRSTRQ